MDLKTIIYRRKDKECSDNLLFNRNDSGEEIKISENEDKLNKGDLKALKHLARDYEKSIEYYNMRTHKGRTLWLGLLSGMARGLGFAIGFTLLALIFIYILRGLVDLPVIGNFIADLLVYIEDVRNIPY